MKYIDPHIHMVSRTTDDYQRMAEAGCVAVTEPAFWAGYDRSSAQGFYDYFRLLTRFEPKRAAEYGIDHYTWICINPKEAENLGLAREVIEIIPEFLTEDTVLGVGEIGLNKNTRNELTILEEQIGIADRHDQLILVHTPHLEDKRKGTRITLDAIKRNGNIDPGRVLIDHVEEHTVKMVLEEGFWAGMTLYPNSKCTVQRAVDIIETYGTERLWVNSAGDWGHSDPMTVPKTAMELKRRGHGPEMFETIAFRNPLTFLSQCPKCKVTDA